MHIVMANINKFILIFTSCEETKLTTVTSRAGYRTQSV